MTFKTKMNLSAWGRKGIGNQITEEDLLGRGGTTKFRPSVKLAVNLKSTPVKDDGQPVTSTEIKDVDIVGPGDVLNVNSEAVMSFYPPKKIPAYFKPYIQFWEPDFAWRYTPAKNSRGKLRPWLAVVACEKTKYTISKNANGVDLVTFNVDGDGYQKIFPDPEIIWKSAHVEHLDSLDFCRIVCLNEEKFNDNTEYTAFVIPVFEATRLRALGYEDDLKETIVQSSAWEATYGAQIANHQKCPLVFPSFFSWDFKAENENFQQLAEALKPFTTETSTIEVDVTDLGEGLSYSTLDPKEGIPDKKSIGMPAATQTMTYVPEEEFPSSKYKNQSQLKTNLENLLNKSTVFQENTMLIGGAINKKNSDPIVTPPIYGGKHAMATSLNDKPWLSSVNLDLHYRAVAGLGKKVVQENQERFVNRAWKQVELVKSLNTKIYNKLLSADANVSLNNKMYKKLFENDFRQGGNNDTRSAFIQNLMQSLQSMIGTETLSSNNSGTTSVKQILENRQIPVSFATTIFQNRARQVASLPNQLDFSFLMENIARGNAYRNTDPKDFNYHSLDALRIFGFQSLLHSRFFVNNQKKGNGKDKTNNKMQLWKNFDFLSIHKKPPQSINLGRIDCSDLKSVVNHVYEFKRKPLAFASDEQIKSAESKYFPIYRLLIRSRWDYFCSHCRTKIDVDLLHLVYARGKACLFRKSDFENLYEVFSKSPAYGRVCNKNADRCVTVGNVIGLAGEIYTKVFCADRRITKIRTVDGDLYFVNKEGLNGITDPLWKNNVSMGYSCDGSFVACDEMNSKIREKERDSSLIVSCSLNFNHTAYKDSVLYDPEIINIHEEALLDESFKDAYLNEIDSVYDWISKYIEKNKDSADKDLAVQAYLKFINELSSCEKRYILKEKKDPSIGVSNSDLNQMQTAIEEESQKSLAESRTIIETYFREFMKSEQLQENYVNDCLQSCYPIMAYPQFPEPTYYYLKQLADKFILPCVDELPDDSVAMFKSNGAFIEAFLCGMNTEMGRELLWREFPTDQRGSYFKKFWDSETSVQNILNDSFFDIESVHKWDNALGKNHKDGKSSLLIFAVKGKMMQRYPDTKIYLQKAAYDGTGKNFKILNEEDDKTIVSPVAEAFFRDDIYLVGFKIDGAKAMGNPDVVKKGSQNTYECGYMLVFKQMMENLDFEYNGEEFNNSVEYADKAVVDPYIRAFHVSSFV